MAKKKAPKPKTKIPKAPKPKQFKKIKGYTPF